MLNKIRNLNLGYFVLVCCLVSVASGLKMQSGEVEKTLLCFDAGCVHVQGISNVALGVFLFVIGAIMIIKERRSRAIGRRKPLHKKMPKGEQLLKAFRGLFVIDESENLTHEN